MLVSGLLHFKGHDVVTVTPSTFAPEVLSALAEHHIGAVVVSGDGRHIDGVLSERDIVRSLAEHGADMLGHTAADLMTTEVFTCEPSTTVEELMSLMTSRRVRHVPVVDNGELAGLVSIGDVVRDRIADLETESQALHDYIAHGR